MTGGWDTFTPTRPFQALWVSLGVLTALPGLTATYLRIVPPSDDVFALLASFVTGRALSTDQPAHSSPTTSRTATTPT